MDILLSLEYGYSVGEILWDVLADGPYKGLWAPENIVSLKPHSIRFEQDDSGEITRAIQSGGMDEIKIPAEKLVIMTYQSEWANPYGKSDLEACYPSWWGKTNAMKWLAMLLERFGVPPIFFFYNPNMYSMAGQDALKDIVTNLQAGTSSILPRQDPKDLEPWTPQLGAHIQDVFIPALDRYDRAMARGLLMPALMGTTPEQEAGSYARAAVVFDVFMFAVDALRAHVEQVIDDQIIWRMIAANYPVSGDEYPRFKFKPLTQDSRIGLMDTWVKLIHGNVAIPREEDEPFVREILGFPAPDSEPLVTPAMEVAEEEREFERKERVEERKAEKKKDSKFSEYSRPYPDPHDERIAQHIDETSGQRAANFKAIEKRRDRIEDSCIGQATNSLQQVFSLLEKTLQAGRKPAPDSIRGMTPYKTALRDMLLDAFDDGYVDLAREMGAPKKFQTLPRVKPKDAIAFLKKKALTLSGFVHDELLRDVKRILIASIEKGMSTLDAIAALGIVFEKWVGSDVFRDGKEVTPSRLEAIARTETTGAYNIGRVVAARDPDIKGLVRGLRHDSILDSRTTEVCQRLNGRIHRIDSADLDALTPPLHVNCRSILTPITISREVDESEFVTPSEVGKAKELAGSGFAGGGSF
jgi:SPP1 gp7 family putative phage head morphogenesis protein